MILALAVLGAAIPFGLYFWLQHKTRTPSLQWPGLAKVLSLRYDSAPPRLSGSWNGRRVAAELVKRRAGLVVPDPVAPLDPSFRGALLARCSVESAGAAVFDAGVQKRPAALPWVDFVGEDTRVVWTVPVLKDPDGAEALLGAVCAVAEGLERFPRGGTTLA
jgi:hypothetical protein